MPFFVLCIKMWVRAEAQRNAYLYEHQF